MFRPVKLPAHIGGHLLLHHMPGRREPLVRVWQEITETRIGSIVSLAGLDETRKTAPEYANAIVNGSVPCDRIEFAFPDYGVPDDPAGLYLLARDLAERLRAGGRLLIHCGAGIGRTGMLAIGILLALDQPLDEARRAVADAGAGPVTPDQDDWVAWCATRATAR